jgi:hypothetical protein
MSDSFEMLVDVEVTAAEAQALSNLVLERFRERGLIIGEPTPDCVLGDIGYRPGPAIPTLNERRRAEQVT